MLQLDWMTFGLPAWPVFFLHRINSVNVLVEVLLDGGGGSICAGRGMRMSDVHSHLPASDRVSEVLYPLRFAQAFDGSTSQRTGATPRSYIDAIFRSPGDERLCRIRHFAYSI